MRLAQPGESFSRLVVVDIGLRAAVPRSLGSESHIHTNSITQSVSVMLFGFVILNPAPGLMPKDWCFQRKSLALISQKFEDWRSTP